MHDRQQDYPALVSLSCIIHLHCQTQQRQSLHALVADQHLTPYCWSTIRRVATVPWDAPFAASPCILVRSTSKGWTQALMMIPDNEPAMVMHRWPQTLRCAVVRRHQA